MKFRVFALAAAGLISSMNSALANQSVWIDVASQQDYAAEHLVDAVHIPYTHIARSVSTRFPDKTTAIKLYDRDEHRAMQAQEALQTLGYQQVTNSGDLATLKESGLATIQSEPLVQTEKISPVEQSAAGELISQHQPQHPTENINPAESQPFIATLHETFNSSNTGD